MPHTPVIDVRALKKTGKLDEERFFRLLSEQCNYVDSKTMRSFYEGLLRHLTKELRTNGVVKMPHLGTISLVKQNISSTWKGQYSLSKTGRYVLTVNLDEGWRDYFKKLAEKGEKLDPREKLLGREL